jgi:hypothetical protein
MRSYIVTWEWWCGESDQNRHGAEDICQLAIELAKEDYNRMSICKKFTIEEIVDAAE